MTVLDQHQQTVLDELENSILYYVTSLPSPDSMEDLKAELEHFGFTLGST